MFMNTMCLHVCCGPYPTACDIQDCRCAEFTTNTHYVDLHLFVYCGFYGVGLPCGVHAYMGAEADKPTKRILEQGDPASAAQTTAAAPTRPLSSPRGGECLLQPTMPLQK